MKIHFKAGLMALSLVLSATPELAHAETTSTPALPNTLRLAPLQHAAVRADPIQDRRTLDARQTKLRVDRIRAQRLPQIGVRAEATTQSDVIEIPFSTPGGSIPTPPKDRYATTLRAELLLWDGGRTGAAQNVQRARQGVLEARLETDLFDVRWKVNTAFFQALALQESLKEIALVIEDLQAQLVETRARVAAGTALRGDAALLEAEVLSAEQRQQSLRSDRRAALDVLERLTHRSLADEVVLVRPRIARRLNAILPVLNASTLELPDSLRVHPRFRILEERRRELDRRMKEVGTGDMPTVSAFAEASYANPGQRQFEDRFDDEWRAGVQLRWTPWDWGDRSRRIEELRVQELELGIERRSLEQSLLRALRSPLRSVEHLQDTLATDSQIIALREVVAEQTRVQFEERAIPASRYVDARTDLSRARVDRAVHRAQLAQARAVILMTLGMEID